jgi:hypothetical protein
VNGDRYFHLPKSDPLQQPHCNVSREFPLFIGRIIALRLPTQFSTGGLPIVVDLALEVDLFSEDTLAQKANHLFYLTKESLRRRQIDTLWQAKRATSPKSLARVLCSENVVTAIRKELKRTTRQSVTDAAYQRHFS